MGGLATGRITNGLKRRSQHHSVQPVLVQAKTGTSSSNENLWQNYGLIFLVVTILSSVSRFELLEGKLTHRSQLVLRLDVACSDRQWQER